MNPSRGAVHIPLLLATIGLSVAVMFFRDDVAGFVQDLRQPAVTTSVPESEPTQMPEPEGPDANETASIFGELLDQASSGQTEASETMQNPSQQAGSYPCNLEQHMLGPESVMPFVGIIAPFPEIQVEYPQDWPQDFIYPQEFKLADHSSGQLTEESAMMYKASLWYKGEPPAAVCVMIDYFEDKDWQVEELVSRDDLGFIVVLMDNDGVGTGLLNVEASSQTDDRSQVSLSVFPEAVQSQ